MVCLPDTLRAFAPRRRSGRWNRASSRPWQHVLEPLSGCYCRVPLSATRKLGTKRLELRYPGLRTRPRRSSWPPMLVKTLVRGRSTAPSTADADVGAKTLRIAIDKIVSAPGLRLPWHLDENVIRRVERYGNYCLDQKASIRGSASRTSRIRGR